MGLINRVYHLFHIDLVKLLCLAANLRRRDTAPRRSRAIRSPTLPTAHEPQNLNGTHESLGYHE
jgi:hypothetical protein